MRCAYELRCAQRHLEFVRQGFLAHGEMQPQRRFSACRALREQARGVNLEGTAALQAGEGFLQEAMRQTQVARRFHE